MKLAQFILEDKIVTLTDTDGRPVSEATALNGGCSPCPYSDSRYGHPMNIPALAQLTGNWDGILNWVSLECSQMSPLRDSLTVAIQATLEPAIYALKHPNAPIPSEMSARYKACLGFCQILTYIVWNDPDPDTAKLGDYGTEDEFFEWLDRERWLLGQTQVCPGPRPLIGQLFNRFCHARAKPESSNNLEETLELVALQSVHILANHKTDGSLASRLLHHGQAPWLFALVQNPDRDPAEVSKLFPQGRIPERVKNLFKNPADERLFLELHNR